MHSDFDEDEESDSVPEWSPYDDEDDMCIDCHRLGSMMDECSICGATMCAGCFEMGCGVCKGPHEPIEGTVHWFEFDSVDARLLAQGIVSTQVQRMAAACIAWMDDIAEGYLDRTEEKRSAKAT